LIWFDLIWFDLIWFDLIWFDLIWSDLRFFDLISFWFDLIWFDARGWELNRFNFPGGQIWWSSTIELETENGWNWIIKESEGGIRRRMRKQPGGESGRHSCMGMEPSVRAAGTHGARFDGSHRGLGNGGCCEVGEPAGVLFDAAARDDQHGYFGRPLREVGHGSSRAAPGAPPPLMDGIENAKVRRVGQAGLRSCFTLGSMLM
jgi:hypothetical protein